MASCNFKWVGGFWRVIHFTVAHAQQAIRRENSHWYYFRRRSQKISTCKNLARVAADEQNGPGVREAPEKAVPTRRKLLIVVFAT